MAALPSIDSGLPFGDFRTLLERLPPLDEGAAARVRDDFDRIERPRDSLGRTEEVAAWLAASTGRQPTVLRPVVAIFAGNHGIAGHGISPHPIEATRRFVELAVAGGAGVNQACAAHGFGLKLYDLALDLPTADFTTHAALDERGCAATMAFGTEAVTDGVDLIALGSIGVGASTAAAAMSAALFGGSGADWVGAGSGADAPMIERKVEILRRLGGREFAAIAGTIIAARTQAAVVLEGFAATAAAAVLHRANPAALDHCLLAYVAATEPGHRQLAKKIGLVPLFGLAMGDGEGTGAALAASTVKAAALIHSEMLAANVVEIVQMEQTL